MGRSIRRITLVAIMVFTARAGAACDGWGMPGVEYGSPLEWSGYAGYSWRDCQKGLLPGFRVTLGPAGGKLALGAEKGSTSELGPRVSASAFVLRAWDAPPHTPPGGISVGAEASVRIPFISRATIGVARRLDASPSAKRYVMTWSVSMDVTAPLLGLLAILFRDFSLGGTWV